MSERLNVVVDASGSMGADGKLDVMRALIVRLKPIAQRFDMETSIFLWREDMQELGRLKDLVPQGRAEAAALSSFIREGDEGACYLLLSDGFWEAEEAAKVKKAIHQKGACLSLVVIGAEARPMEMKCSLGLDMVWRGEDIVSAIRFLHRDVSREAAL